MVHMQRNYQFQKKKLLCNDICEGSPLFEVAFILPLDTVEEDCGTEHC